MRAALAKLILMLLSLEMMHARADELTIEWDRDPQAAQYELQVQRGEEVVFNKRFEGKTSSWKGDLPFGSYAYKLRSFDTRGRASAWSDPTPFFVTPPPPSLLIPPNASKVLSRSKLGVAFKWSDVRGVKKYVLTVFGAAQPIRLVVEGTQATVPQLSPGDYSWQVAPIFTTAGKGESSEVADVKTSALFKFQVEMVQGGSSYDGDFQKIKLEAYGNGREFASGDLVCFYKDKTRAITIGCGKVESASDKKMEVRLLSQSSRIKSGVRLIVTKMDDKDRSPAAVTLDNIYEVVNQGMPYNLAFNAGLMAGLSYFFPAVGVQTTLFTGTAIGLRGFFTSDEAGAVQASLVGASFTLTQFFGSRNFSGLFAELGASAYFFSASNATSSEKARMSPGGQLSLGWQFRPSQQGFNASFSLGAQYIDTPKVTIVQSQLKGVLPLFTLLIGYAF